MEHEIGATPAESGVKGLEFCSVGSLHLLQPLMFTSSLPLSFLPKGKETFFQSPFLKNTHHRLRRTHTESSTLPSCGTLTSSLLPPTVQYITSPYRNPGTPVSAAIIPQREEMSSISTDPLGMGRTRVLWDGGRCSPQAAPPRIYRMKPFSPPLRNNCSPTRCMETLISCSCISN